MSSNTPNFHIKCYGCDVQNITGRFYKCLVCENLTLCANCHDHKVIVDDHVPLHPMQCVLSRTEIELFFGGEEENMLFSQSLTCPICGEIGFHARTILRHLIGDHSSDTHRVLCPLCIILSPRFRSNYVNNLSDHMGRIHRQAVISLSTDMRYMPSRLLPERRGALLPTDAALNNIVSNLSHRVNVDTPRLRTLQHDNANANSINIFARRATNNSTIAPLPRLSELNFNEIREIGTTNDEDIVSMPTHSNVRGLQDGLSNYSNQMRSTAQSTRSTAQGSTLSERLNAFTPGPYNNGAQSNMRTAAGESTLSQRLVTFNPNFNQSFMMRPTFSGQVQSHQDAGTMTDGGPNATGSANVRNMSPALVAHQNFNQGFIMRPSHQLNGSMAGGGVNTTGGPIVRLVRPPLAAYPNITQSFIIHPPFPGYVQSQYAGSITEDGGSNATGSANVRTMSPALVGHPNFNQRFMISPTHQVMGSMLEGGVNPTGGQIVRNIRPPLVAYPNINPFYMARPAFPGQQFLAEGGGNPAGGSNIRHSLSHQAMSAMADSGFYPTGDPNVPMIPPVLIAHHMAGRTTPIRATIVRNSINTNYTRYEFTEADGTPVVPMSMPHINDPENNLSAINVPPINVPPINVPPINVAPINVPAINAPPINVHVNSNKSENKKAPTEEDRFLLPRIINNANTVEDSAEQNLRSLFVQHLCLSSLSVVRDLGAQHSRDANDVEAIGNQTLNVTPEADNNATVEELAATTSNAEPQVDSSSATDGTDQQ